MPVRLLVASAIWSLALGNGGIQPYLMRIWVARSVSGTEKEVQIEHDWFDAILYDGGFETD